MPLKPFALVLAFSFSQLSFAQGSEREAQFAEAMSVCDNMTLYVDSAKRQRIMGLPLESAEENLRSLMRRNLKLPEDLKQASIDLAAKIYEYVYAQELVGALSTERVLSATCGAYRGYEIPVDRVTAHVQSTTQSAWNPLERVPLCVKVAQSVSNIATGRDRGIPRERMTEIASTSLKDDLFTSERLPSLLAAAYERPLLEAGQLYAYAVRQCSQERAGKKYPRLEVVRNELAACSESEQRAERESCTLKILGVVN